MNKRALSVMVLLNVVLLIGLMTVCFTPEPVAAQLGGRGDYLMIAGQVTGRSDQAAVYILDLRTQTVAAVLFDSRNKRLQGIARRTIRDDIRGRGTR